MKHPQYERVRSSRLYEDVAAQLQEAIFSDELQPGDRLPSESELVEQFGVSRTVIREAIQSLRSRGLVDVVQGSGVFVSTPKPNGFVEALSTFFHFASASLIAIHEVREILETEIAGLAAERASEDDKADLLNALEWMERVCSSPRDYVEVDLLFHVILARAAKNEVFLLLLEPLIDLMRQSRLQAIQAPGGIDRSYQGHKAIYECIVAKDREGARAAMLEHLGEVRERLVAVDADASFRQQLAT